MYFLLFDRLGTGFFLCFFHSALEPALFLLGRGLRLTVQSFDAEYVNAAYDSLYLFFDRDAVKDFFIADKR